MVICRRKILQYHNEAKRIYTHRTSSRSYIIYNRSFIEEELVDIMKNLYDPKKPLSRRQLMKNFVPFSRY